MTLDERRIADLEADNARLRVQLERFCLQWIEHNTNYNDRVPSRDQLNALARVTLGELTFHAARETVLLKCRVGDAERRDRLTRP